MELDKAIIQLYPDTIFPIDVRLRDTGSGPFIAEWNRPEPQPTPAQLEAAWQAWQAGEPARVAKEEDIKQAPIGARAWFDANPNGKLLFTLSIPDLSAEISTLVEALFPAATAGNRTKMKLLLMAIAVSVRVLVKRELLP